MIGQPGGFTGGVCGGLGPVLHGGQVGGRPCGFGLGVPYPCNPVGWVSGDGGILASGLEAIRGFSSGGLRGGVAAYAGGTVGGLGHYGGGLRDMVKRVFEIWPRTFWTNGQILLLVFGGVRGIGRQDIAATMQAGAACGLRHGFYVGRQYAGQTLRGLTGKAHVFAGPDCIGGRVTP